jgi:hypothetical protein
MEYLKKGPENGRFMRKALKRVDFKGRSFRINGSREASNSEW